MNIENLMISASIVVIAAFGYQQFNRWTDVEARGGSSDSDLLAFAPPRSFTSLWRFSAVAFAYCLTLIAFYAVLLLYFRSAPQYLESFGVTKENAWMFALFVVTGLSPIVPGFKDIERSVREVMHAWAVVPAKAHQVADDLASPTTSFEFDEPFLREVVLPHLGPLFRREDFADARASSIAQKWCRLNYLLHKFAPPANEGLAARGLRSPYTVRFQQDLGTLRREIEDQVKARGAEEFLRGHGGSPDAVALAERIDAMLHRLYVLMCCRALASVPSTEGAVKYFRRSYGIRVHSVEMAPFPTDPMFDALMAVFAAVLAISLGFKVAYPDSDVQPFVWALCAFATHGLGAIVGWLIFTHNRRQQSEMPWGQLASAPLSRRCLVASVVLGFTLATIPTWAATLHYLNHLKLTSPFDPATVGEWLLGPFVVSWPWGFLGSATAVAVFVHLERTANREISHAIRAASACGQACANLLISLSILALYNPGVAARSLTEKLVDPVTQLVLVLTAAIGLVLGFFLPRVVHGHGVDRRGGAVRRRPAGESATAVFTSQGGQYEAEVLAISLTGCVLRFRQNSPILVPGRFGTLTLNGPAVLTAQVARDLRKDDAALSGMADDMAPAYAFKFAAAGQQPKLGKSPREQLLRILGKDGLVSAKNVDGVRLV